MNKFLKDLFEGKELQQLTDWSENFWKYDQKNLKIQFAQQGYEDKGFGHIQRIIANVGELLENYFKLPHDVQPNTKNKDEFCTAMKEDFRYNLILFYVAAHLHDIGMKFPGIFESLSEYIGEQSQNPLHIGEIIHDYHHYTSFIILMEMSCNVSFDKKSIKKRPYLQYIKGGELIKSAIEDLKGLNKCLAHIHSKMNMVKFIPELKDFKVILAILCLLHKEVNEEYVRSILKNLKGNEVNSVDTFNKWWGYLERSTRWTDKIFQRFSRNDNSKVFGINDHELIIIKNTSNNNSGNQCQILDLLLVEALLQYGDKTEISIARIARKPAGYRQIPLKNFYEDCAFDNRDGYICTNIKQRIISDFARFRACRFIPVIIIKVERASEHDDKGLDIVIHYLRFEEDDDVFKLIRYHNEKDFFDLHFLRVIRFHLPVIIHLLKENGVESLKKIQKKSIFSLTFKKKEHYIRLEKEIFELSKSFKDTKNGLKEILNIWKDCKDKENFFPYTRKNRKAIRKFSQSLLNREERNRRKDSQKVFYEMCDSIVPASFDIMAVLNLFVEEEE